MDHDQQLRLLYLLAVLVLPVAALVNHLRARKEGARPVTVQDGDRTLSGVYWMDGHIVYVNCEAGRRGRPPGPDGPLKTAERLLIEINRASGQIDPQAP